MQCHACNHVNGPQSRFCAECGARLERACPSCGEPVGRDHRFCQACGAALAGDAGGAEGERPQAGGNQGGERRQVTVLFGDLSGFTAMSNRLDPEETHALLNRYFARVDAVVRRYGGAIDKHIGDGVMAVFGAPVAHSDDPERAMRAALEIHAALAAMDPPLTAHVGIASGTVVASGTGSDAHSEYTVIGESVNLAARLQDRAGGGETFISDDVHAAAGDRFDCEPLGDLEIKGLARPVAAWRLLAVADDDRGRRELPFIGRRSELALFAGALDAGLAHNSGQVIVLRGEPGIGKTRLLAEYRRFAADRDVTWLSGLILDFGTAKGRDAISTIVLGLLGIAANADAAGKAAAVETAIAGGRIDGEQRVYIHDLLGLPQPADLRSIYDAMDDSTRIAGKQALIAAMIRETAAVSPLIVAVEDVHWANAVTLSYLARIAEACADSAALLLMTTRIDEDPIDAAWRASTGGAPLTTVDLGPLRRDEALALASELFDVAGQFAESCVVRSGGNPLFLEQLLRAAEDASDSEIPSSVQSVVLARMDMLEIADRQALQAASVLGQRFTLDALRHLIGNPAYDCHALVNHFLVRPEGSGFLFAHALVRDGVYSSLLKPRRGELHRRAADWFAAHDPALRAEHLDRAGDPGAAAAYLAAAEEAAAAYRNERALALSARGLELATAPLRHAICCFRGDVLRGIGEIERSIAAFRDALAAAGDALQRSRAWIGLAEGMRVSDRHAEALDALDTAERDAVDGPPLALAEIHHLRGNLYFPAGRGDDCFRQHEAALGYARKAKSREWEARALGGLGDASYLDGRMRTACRHFRRCVELCHELGLGRIEVANRHMVGWSRMYLNEIGDAAEDGYATAEMAAKVGQNRTELLGRLLASYMHLEQLQLDDADREAEKSVALGRRLGASHFIAEGLCFQARILMERDRLDAARERIDEAVAIVRQAGVTFFGPLALGIAARLAEDPADRAALLAEGDAVLDGGCVGHNYFWFYREAIEASLAGGDWAGAERYADALESYAAAEPLPWSELFAARGRALARFGRGERGETLAADLAAILTTIDRDGFAAHRQAVAGARAAV